MQKKKRKSNKHTSVKVGNISDISGTVNVAGGNIATHHAVTGLSAAEIKELFDQLYAKIETRPETRTADKEDRRGHTCAEVQVWWESARFQAVCVA